MCRAFQWHWFTAWMKEETEAWQEGGCVPPEAPNGCRSKKAQLCYTGATNTLDRLRVAACVQHVSFSTSISPRRGFRCERAPKTSTWWLSAESSPSAVWLGGATAAMRPVVGMHCLGACVVCLLFCATTKFIKPTRDEAQIVTRVNLTLEPLRHDVRPIDYKHTNKRNE